MKNDLKHLRRSELIDLIYEMKKREIELQTRLDEAEAKLQAREITIEKAGSIADAAVQLSGVFQAAQEAADSYLKSIKAKEKENRRGRAAAKFARPVSLIFSIVLVVLAILVVVLIVAPELGRTLVNVVKKVEEDIPLVQKWLTDTFQSDSEIVKWASTIEIDPQKIIDSIVSVLRSGADNLVSSTITVTMGLVSMAMNFAIGFVFSCYVLLQKEKLGRQVLKAAYAILPVKTVEYLGHVCTLASKVFSSFITGQCIEAVILGSMFFVSMTIGRFPYAMLIGVLISFTALIPVFGGIIGCWVGFFLILMVSPLKALAFLILFLILQQIEGNLIYPHVVGNSVGLPAIWVLVAVTLGGNLMGIVGMLIFIPLVSVIYTLFKEWVSERLEQKKVKIS